MERIAVPLVIAFRGIEQGAIADNTGGLSYYKLKRAFQSGLSEVDRNYADSLSKE